KRRVRKFPISASFATFLAKRLVTLGIMVFAGIYITVVIANYGGYFDDALRAEIEIR
ncbi:MAG: hypothetical protein GTO30_18285, partial [Acidobacteria bacterium]|nr:hypothetical protein [Acidobacteriota bacterium]NIQ87003.1 hypothetical protein [Acidobacteriota bacterium]